MLIASELVALRGARKPRRQIGNIVTIQVPPPPVNLYWLVDPTPRSSLEFYDSMIAIRYCCLDDVVG